jgi:hypothetical protein
MVEAQVRDAISQTRSEVAETIHSLGERVDAVWHSAEKMAGETDHLKGAAAQAGAKVADFGQHALGNAASQLKATTPKQRLLVPILLAAGLALLGAVALLITKRHRDVAEEPLGWEVTEE